MRFFRFKSPGWLSAIVLAVFLASAPAPVHAAGFGDVVNIIGTLIKNLGGWFQQLFGYIDKDITGTLQGLNVLARQIRDATTYGAIENNRAAMGTVVGLASLNYEPPTEYACAVVTDDQTLAARYAAEAITANAVGSLLALVFDDPRAGEPIPRAALQRIYCALGVTGPDAPFCEVAQVEKVRDAHIDFNKAIAGKWCIPFDIGELRTELTRAVQGTSNGRNDYTLGNENMREAMVAILYLRRMLGSHCTWTRGPARQTLSGVDAYDRLNSVLAARYAKLPALVELLKQRLCFNEATMLPQCSTQDTGMRDYLKNRYGTSTTDRPWMPPGNYCLSRLQTDIARTIRDAEIAPRRLPPGTQAERHTWLSQLQETVISRMTAHQDAATQASAVAQETPMPNFDDQCPRGAETVKPTP